MARKIDVNKIENIKKAAIEIMIEVGFRGTTIADIARKAHVSTGYLYRYYDSKEDLVDDIMNTHMRKMMDRIIQLFNSSKNFKDGIYEYIRALYEWVKIEEVSVIGFIIALASDKKLIDGYMQAEKEACLSIQNFLDLCLKQKEINPKTTMEDFMVMVIVVPFKYLETRMTEENYKELLNEEFKSRITEICINALK